MSKESAFDPNKAAGIREMLLGSGYSERAIQYYLERPYMGSLDDPDLVTELTGHCGDTMKFYLKLDRKRRVQDARYQVLGCPGAIASAMAAVELIKGKTLNEAMALTDRDVFRALVDLPDQKQHCIRLAVKTLQKAIDEYRGKVVTDPGSKQ